MLLDRFISLCALIALVFTLSTAGADDAVAQSNRLGKEASPYLRQHAAHPVDWYPWGEEAFAKAKKENKPIFLSVGYSTCHWCHVMARESFANEEIAKILNAHFVSIKLDREERPDIDKVYMTAYQALTGESGGWPLNVFLTPDLDPFYGGTYFPPTSRGERVGFDAVLTQLATAWQMKNDQLVESAEALRKHIAEYNGVGSRSEEVPDRAILQKAAKLLLDSGDPLEGGWARGPKFPMPSHLAYLIRAWSSSQDSRLLAFAELTAQKMMRGGIADQLGGGVHRYSVDGKWLVPHFEKMLYDQAQLLDVYLDLYQITKKQQYANMAHRICGYVLSTLTDPNGAFYCAEDAQSEGKEGKFFCWTTAELKTLLDAQEFELVCAYYGISEKGNFFDHSDPEALKGQNVLSLTKPTNWLASEPERLKTLELAIAKMKKARAGRVRPAVDTKVLASWNGMMIGALARAGVVLDEPRYIAAAQKAHRFVRENMWDGSTLAHRWHEGAVDSTAQAQSYLLMLQASRRLYELSLDAHVLDFAVVLAERAVNLFYDYKGGGFYESAEAADVRVRLKGDHDGAMPTASSIAALEYLKLAEITGRDDFSAIGLGTLKGHGQALEQAPTSMTSLLEALDFHYAKRQRLVLAKGENGLKTFYEHIGSRYQPVLTVMGNRGAVAEFERGLKPQDGKTTAYLCEGETCRPPVVEPSELWK